MALSGRDLKRQKKKERAARKRLEKETKAHSKILKRAVVLVVLFLIISGGGYLIFSAAVNTPGIGPLNSAHEHADWAMYINGKPIDLSSEKYRHKSDYVHMEGDAVIHLHATNVPIGYLLSSIGLGITRTSIMVDGVMYENDGDKKLRVLVNDNESSEADKQIIKSLDKILIVYGNESEEQVKEYLKAIPDDAKKVEMGNPGIANPAGAGGR